MYQTKREKACDSFCNITLRYSFTKREKGANKKKGESKSMPSPNTRVDEETIDSSSHHHQQKMSETCTVYYK